MPNKQTDKQTENHVFKKHGLGIDPIFGEKATIEVLQDAWLLWNAHLLDDETVKILEQGMKNNAEKTDTTTPQQ